MSLGSTDPLDRAHLAKLARLIARTEPALVSEHLCWSGVGGRALNDLLPLPYTEEALAHVCARVAEVQDFLGREILVENVSTYLAFADATIPEWEFVAARRAPHRLQAPARRQQHLRQRGQPRLRRRRVSRRAAARGDRRDPSRRLRGDRRPASSTRTARRSRRRSGRFIARAIARFGPRADADRMGHRHPAARDAARRGGDGATDPGHAPMPSLRELQQDFAATLFAGDGVPPPFATIPDGPRRRAHRHLSPRAVRELPQRARRDAIPSCKRLVGAPFFDAAVDAFVAAASVDERRSQRLRRRVRRVSRGIPARPRTCLISPTSRALEWAKDEANRARRRRRSRPTEVLAAAHGHAAGATCRSRSRACARRAASSHRAIPSCASGRSIRTPIRVTSALRSMRRPDRLLVRREPDGHHDRAPRPPANTRGSQRWPRARSLGAAIEAAQNADAEFDLGTALRARIADGTIVGVRSA